MLLVFKLVSILTLVVFFYYGYDMKRRSDWKPLAPGRSIFFMKLMAVLLGLILCGAIFSIKALKSSDLLALLLFTAGALIVRASKIELERNNAFTWTGYALETPNLVTTGIYKYIRHPLYTGVYLTELGGAIVVLSRTKDWFLDYNLMVNFILILGLGYAMAFNSLLARKESKNLEKIFGASYLDYSQEVHPFIPFINTVLPFSKR